MAFRGIHVLVLVAVILGAFATAATEYYATRYQSLPVIDWLESRPPLVQSQRIPAAADLAHGFVAVIPLLTIDDDVRPLLPIFGPPGPVQRTIGGVRDAARIELGSPAPATTPAADRPIRARLDVIVFNRSVRAAAWSDLLGRTMDIRDPQSGIGQVRVTGPELPDTLWIIGPKDRRGGVATLVGYRGPVAYELQVTYQRPVLIDPVELLDLSARADALARQAGADWAAWLQSQPGVSAA